MRGYLCTVFAECGIESTLEVDAVFSFVNPQAVIAPIDAYLQTTPQAVLARGMEVQLLDLRTGAVPCLLLPDQTEAGLLDAIRIHEAERAAIRYSLKAADQSLGEQGGILKGHQFTWIDMGGIELTQAPASLI